MRLSASSIRPRAKLSGLPSRPQGARRVRAGSSLGGVSRSLRLAPPRGAAGASPGGVNGASPAGRSGSAGRGLRSSGSSAAGGAVPSGCESRTDGRARCPRLIRALPRPARPPCRDPAGRPPAGGTRGGLEDHLVQPRGHPRPWPATAEPSRPGRGWAPPAAGGGVNTGRALHGFPTRSREHALMSPARRTDAATGQRSPAHRHPVRPGAVVGCPIGTRSETRPCHWQSWSQ